MTPVARLLAAAGHDVVVPSLPGFTFSAQQATAPGEIPTHELWHRLMTGLGYTRYVAHGGDQQQTRPVTLAYGLSDSPAGLLGWITEKYRSWSDCGGDISTRWADDDILVQASLYWFTNTIGTSFRPYYDYLAHPAVRPRMGQVPTAVAVFPHDISCPPREYAERTYNVVRYTRFDRGGHFAPHEEPELLAGDIAAFAAQV